ncbi:MAG: four helix bundle protein [Candidatus Uhrbacteria bacterium]
MDDVYSIKPYQNILAWQKSYEFVIEVYRLTKRFPGEERYGITSQLRRAAVSVSANIVEGRAKQTEKDFLRYLNIAKASLWECQFFLKLSKDLGYLSDDEYIHLEDLRTQTDFLLFKFTERIKN